MTIESVQNKDILAYKSSCYLGMTEEEAKEMGRSIFREFKKIDNGDGELSFEEITEQRDEISRKKQRWGNIFMGIGAYYCLNGISLEKVSKQSLEKASEIVSNMFNENMSSTKIRRLNFLYALFFTGIGIVKSIKSKKIDEETQRYTNNYYGQIAT